MNKKKLLVVLPILMLFSLTIVSAMEVDLFMPENKEVFTINAPVVVGFSILGNYSYWDWIHCVFEQKSSNRYFEVEPDEGWFKSYPYVNYVWLINDLYDYHLYNGRYKLQVICTDTNGNVGESEIIKFHVKGDMRWAEDYKKDWRTCFDKYQKCSENHEFDKCYEKYSKCVDKVLT